VTGDRLQVTGYSEKAARRRDLALVEGKAICGNMLRLCHEVRNLP
jgi:hypothetical protein